eukprot:gnl/TRDRNA2_/TRDRNA2_83785_c0_seq1.p1 gnl/TRDRNA2_/TRDRNA2_83785_c0~~gnl/TRDRNA2_/TRDRNA2_83785_c0_seq1.p1  ORF type:complete len:569 (-),score=167.11 gnl/TRDRNA2_/TRDRNA2_83785_c0_seq1:87-1634(-)
MEPQVTDSLVRLQNLYTQIRSSLTPLQNEIDKIAPGEDIATGVTSDDESSTSLTQTSATSSVETSTSEQATAQVALHNQLLSALEDTLTIMEGAHVGVDMSSDAYQKLLTMVDQGQELADQLGLEEHFKGKLSSNSTDTLTSEVSEMDEDEAEAETDDVHDAVFQYQMDAAHNSFLDDSEEEASEDEAELEQIQGDGLSSQLFHDDELDYKAEQYLLSYGADEYHEDDAHEDKSREAAPDTALVQTKDTEEEAAEKKEGSEHAAEEEEGSEHAAEEEEGSEHAAEEREDSDAADDTSAPSLLQVDSTVSEEDEDYSLDDDDVSLDDEDDSSLLEIIDQTSASEPSGESLLQLDTEFGDAAWEQDDDAADSAEAAESALLLGVDAEDASEGEDESFEEDESLDEDEADEEDEAHLESLLEDDDEEQQEGQEEEEEEEADQGDVTELAERDAEEKDEDHSEERKDEPEKPEVSDKSPKHHAVEENLDSDDVPAPKKHNEKELIDVPGSVSVNVPSDD